MLFLVDSYHKELLPEPGEAVRELNAPNPSQAHTPEHPTQVPSGLGIQLVTAQEAEALFLGRNGLVGATVCFQRNICFHNFSEVAVDFQPLCLVRKHLECPFIS